MRVGLDVHVVSGPEQGTATVWHSLLRALPSTHEYVLYSFDARATSRLFPGQQFLHRQCPAVSPFIRIPLVYPLLARRDGCDVFHVNYYGPFVGAPGLVVTIHDLIYLDFPQFAAGVRRAQFEWFVRLTAKAAREIITVSEYSKGRILHHFGIPERKVTVVYNGLDNAWLHPDQGAIDAAETALAGVLPARFALMVGRLDSRKNVVTAARVVAELCRSGELDALVVVGPEEMDAAGIRATLKADGTDRHVVHLSGLGVPELQAVYRLAQCLLYLSFAEGFGLPLVEAMAMGTPVVASDRTAVPEICGDAALIVNPDDRASVSAAVRAVLDDARLRSELVTRGTRRVRTFTNAAMANEVVRIYERAAGR